MVPPAPNNRAHNRKLTVLLLQVDQCVVGFHPNTVHLVILSRTDYDVVVQMSDSERVNRQENFTVFLVFPPTGMTLNNPI